MDGLSPALPAARFVFGIWFPVLALELFGDSPSFDIYRVDGAKQLSDGRLVSWSTIDHTIRVWDLPSGRCVAAQNIIAERITQLSNGAILAVNNDSVYVWNIESGKVLEIE